MQIETTDRDAPLIGWKPFFTRFALAVLALLAGTGASLLIETGGHLALAIGLALLGCLVMLGVIAFASRQSDEFDRSLVLQAGTFAGLSTVMFLVISEVSSAAGLARLIWPMALPGFYLMQWLILEQYLRWAYARTER